MFQIKKSDRIITDQEVQDNVLTITIDPQLKSEQEYNKLQSLAQTNSNSIFIFLIIGVCFQLFMSVSMELIWTVLSMLQLVCHIRYLGIQTPSPVLVLLNTVEKICNFRFHKVPEIQQWLRETLNPLLVFMEELGIILVSIIAIFVILGVLFALAYLFRKSEKVIKKIEELKAKLMWSSVLRSAM